MLLSVPDVFSPAEVRDIRAALEGAPWGDGRMTAGHQSAKVKHNEQLPENSPLAAQLREKVLTRLSHNALFITAALPARVYPPLFNRYGPGMGFGSHVDNALRGTGDRLRTDVSATLFFSDPHEYDGGELVIDDAFGAQTVKLPAGHLILYPATSLHRVAAITRGWRYASFFWVQSLVRDAAQRALLFDLDVSIQGLRRRSGDAPELLTLEGCYHNLLRRWAEPA